MTNREKLKKLLMDVFLLEEDRFSFDLELSGIDSWDSLALVAMATGIEETFGYHMNPQEANRIKRVQDIMDLLGTKGVHFDG